MKSHTLFCVTVTTLFLSQLLPASGVANKRREVDPERGFRGITITTEAEFKKVVHDHTRDVFAFLSKEGCTHCAAAKPMMTKLARYFEHEPTLAIAIIDTSSKYLPERAWRTVFSELEGFPSIYLRAAQQPSGPKEEPVEFTKSRKTGEVERWICSGATHITQHCGAMFGGRPAHDEV